MGYITNRDSRWYAVSYEGLDHRTNEACELIDDRQRRAEANRANLDDLHLVTWARRIPTRRFQVHHDQVHRVDAIRARRRNVDEFASAMMW